MGRMMDQRGFKEYVRLITDPCHAPFSEAPYLGVESGYYVRTKDQLQATFNMYRYTGDGSADFANTTGPMDLFFQYNPSAGYGDGTDITTQITQTATIRSFTSAYNVSGGKSGANLPFIQYCARVQRDSGNTGTQGMNFYQSFETVNSIPFKNKTVTLSFYARAGANYSPSSSTLNSGLYYGTGTDQNYGSSYTGATAVFNQANTLTTTWQRFTVSGTVSTSANELAVVFQNTPTGTAGSNDYYEVTGVQLEIAGSASAYSPNTSTYQAELAACQRYYYRASAGSQAYARFGIARSSSTTNLEFCLVLPTTMRVNPTAVEFSTLTTTNAQNVSAAALNSPSQNSASIDLTVGSATANQPYTIMANNSTSAYVAVTAEL